METKVVKRGSPETLRRLAQFQDFQITQIVFWIVAGGIANVLADGIGVLKPLNAEGGTKIRQVPGRGAVIMDHKVGKGAQTKAQASLMFGDLDADRIRRAVVLNQPL